MMNALVDFLCIVAFLIFVCCVSGMVVKKGHTYFVIEAHARLVSTGTVGEIFSQAVEYVVLEPTLA